MEVFSHIYSYFTGSEEKKPGNEKSNEWYESSQETLDNDWIVQSQSSEYSPEK